MRAKFALLKINWSLWNEEWYAFNKQMLVWSWPCALIWSRLWINFDIFSISDILICNGSFWLLLIKQQYAAKHWLKILQVSLKFYETKVKLKALLLQNIKIQRFTWEFFIFVFHSCNITLTYLWSHLLRTLNCSWWGSNLLTCRGLVFFLRLYF